MTTKEMKISKHELSTDDIIALTSALTDIEAIGLTFDTQLDIKSSSPIIMWRAKFAELVHRLEKEHIEY
jgi:hypothetical protein